MNKNRYIRKKQKHQDVAALHQHMSDRHVSTNLFRKVHISTKVDPSAKINASKYKQTKIFQNVAALDFSLSRARALPLSQTQHAVAVRQHMS